MAIGAAETDGAEESRQWELEQLAVPPITTHRAPTTGLCHLGASVRCREIAPTMVFDSTEQSTDIKVWLTRTSRGGTFGGVSVAAVTESGSEGLSCRKVAEEMLSYQVLLVVIICPTVKQWWWWWWVRLSQECGAGASKLVTRSTPIAAECLRPWILLPPPMRGNQHCQVHSITIVPMHRRDHYLEHVGVLYLSLWYRSSCHRPALDITIMATNGGQLG